MHNPHPPLPPAACRAAITATWEEPRALPPFFEATTADTMHDFLVTVPRPDFVSNTQLRRIDKVYTFDLP